MTSLRQLQFIVALNDALNFSRAADACFVTQPTLSAGLKDFEEAHGVRLAERTKRSVVMTPIGQQIAARARAVLTSVQDIEELAARSRGLLRGDIRLGAISTIGPYLIPRALKLLRAQFPDLRLYLREEPTKALIDGLNAGRLDVILMALPFDTHNIETECLFDDGYQLATPLNHDLPANKTQIEAMLAQTPLLLLEDGHCLQNHVLSAFANVAITQDETFAATSLNTLISMVEEGLGITLLPQIAIDAGVATGASLSLTNLPKARPRQIALAWRPTSAFAESFTTLAAIFRKARLAG